MVLKTHFSLKYFAYFTVASSMYIKYTLFRYTLYWAKNDDRINYSTSIIVLNLPEKMYYSLFQEYICYYLLFTLNLRYTFFTNWISSSNFVYIATAKPRPSVDFIPILISSPYLYKSLILFLSLMFGE